MDKTIYTREYSVVLKMLRQAREQAGFTQVQFAAKLGQTQSFVSKIERGERRLDIVQLRTVCRVLGMTAAEFVRQWEEHLPKGK